MCNSPRTITVVRKYPKSDAAPYLHSLKSYPGYMNEALLRLNPYLTIDAPCGKCADCLRRKQKCIETRFLRESSVNPLMFFVTLTYRQEKMPMALSYWVTDKDTGEQFCISKPSVVAPKFNRTTLGCELDVTRRELLTKMRTMTNPNGVEYLNIVCHDYQSYLCEARATPSLCRRDVQLWLKRCRVRYERQYGEQVSKFRYYVCGEYGFNTNRPHYHIAFFGLPERQLDFFLDSWKSDFGFITKKRVYARNKDGSNAFLLVGKYVAKYMTKGESEFDGVVDGFVEKPRVMSSKSFGVGKVDDAMKAHFLGYRFYGVYDPDTFIKKDGSKLTQSELHFLVEYVATHLYFDIDGYLYPVPSLVRKRIFGIYKSKTLDDGTEIKTFVRFSTLYVLAMAFARDLYLAERNREAAANGIHPDAENFSFAVAAFAAIKEASAASKNKAFQKAVISFLQKSIV